MTKAPRNRDAKQATEPASYWKGGRPLQLPRTKIDYLGSKTRKTKHAANVSIRIQHANYISLDCQHNLWVVTTRAPRQLLDLD